MVDTSAVTSATQYAKARIRRTMKASQVVFETLRPELRAAKHVLICVARDEGSRLAFFLDYHRKLGIEQFIFIDNGSSDGSIEFLKSQDDVSLLLAKGSYKAARFGNDWVNQIINTHCQQKWVLYIDPDEFLVYPHCDTRPITALTDYMAAVGARSLRMVMVDMYSKGSVMENTYEPGSDPLNVCNLFDRSGYQSHFDRNSRTLWVKGGVRGRLYFQNSIWDGPALNKTPLIYVDGETYFLKSTHQVWPLSLNLGLSNGAINVTGALLHFKFLSSFFKKVEDIVSRSEGTQEYALYNTDSEREEFMSDRTAVYRNWRDLADNGLLQGEGWKHWEIVSDEVAAGNAA